MVLKRVLQGSPRRSSSEARWASSSDAPLVVQVTSTAMATVILPSEPAVLLQWDLRTQEPSPFFTAARWGSRA